MTLAKGFSSSNCHLSVTLVTCKNEEKWHGRSVGKGKEGRFTCVSCLISVILTPLQPCVPLDLCPPSFHYLHTSLMICHQTFKSIVTSFCCQIWQPVTCIDSPYSLGERTPSNICSSAMLYWMQPMENLPTSLPVGGK